MIYILYVFLLLIFSFLGQHAKNGSIFRVFIYITFSLLIGLRSESIGVDSRTYYESYYYYGQWGYGYVEYGFDKLVQFLFAKGYSAYILFLTMSAATCFFIYLLLEQYKKEYFVLSCLLYTMTYVFIVNGMRQALACSVFLYAYQSIERKKIFWYFALILFAFLFHASVLFLLPFYFIDKIKVTNKVALISFVISFFFIFIDISSFLPEILSYFELGNRNYGQLYSEVTTESASYFGFIFTSILNVSIFYLMIKSNSFKKYKILSLFVLFYFILRNLGFNIPLVGRITIYFAWFQYILLAKLLLRDKVKLFYNDKVATNIFYVFMYSMILLNTIISDANKLLPYNFNWE